MMLADPRLVVIQPVEMLQEFEVALDRQGRVLVVIMKRRQEDAASQIAITHDVASGAGRSPVVIVGDWPRWRQAISGRARIRAAHPSPAQCGKGGALDGNGKGSRREECGGDPQALDRR